MWQAIETAPKPTAGYIGPRVLIFEPNNSPDGHVTIGWTVKGRWCSSAANAPGGPPAGAWPNPTHWMPLPEPPPIDWKPKVYDPTYRGKWPGNDAPGI